MKRLEDILKKLYPDEYNKILTYLSKEFSIINPTTSSLKNEDKHWFKYLNLYVVYPDSFIKDNNTNFNTLKEKVAYINNMGFNAIHVLPFFDSPMIDYGFDVSNYYNVREELGGMSGFNIFLNECNKLGIKVFIDLILNHVSNKNEWFIKALNGEKKFIKFFYHFDSPPKLIKKFKNKNAVWATYYLDQKEVSIPIIFPEQSGVLPHFFKVNDKSYFYHSFYPYQIDLNWDSVDLFIEMSKILIFWAKKSINFRLDAITHIGKDFSNNKLENTKKTHLLIEALRKITKKINFQSIFLVEAALPTPRVIKYFGSSRHPESELAYGFNIMSNLWKLILFKEFIYLKKIIDIFKITPNNNSWVSFIRNHDELSIKFGKDLASREIYKKLTASDLPFREGLGISGRTYSLLNNDDERFLMAYFLLASIPGNLSLIYGDEIGKENDYQFMKQSTKLKKERFNDDNIKDDTRDINRSRISEIELIQPKSIYIKEQISKIFNNKLNYKEIYVSIPLIFEIQKGLIQIEYKLINKIIKIFINLDEEIKEISINEDLNYKITVNKVSSINSSIIRFDRYGCIWSEVIMK